MGLDIGADSLATFKHELSDCQTVVWNGPMGVFEFEKFSHGTFGVAHALADITERYVRCSLLSCFISTRISSNNATHQMRFPSVILMTLIQP